MNAIKSKNSIKIIVTIAVVLAIFFTLKSLSKPNNAQNSQLEQKSVEPRATQTLNKEFSFPLKDRNNKEVGKVKMIIEKVELVDEIVVKGQKATAVSGRTFLIVNLKLINELDQTVQINTKDYIRLSVNGNETELLAPDIHNDPVETQAISTKFTRVGFPVNTTDKDFTLQVGEIKGEKQKVKLELNH